MKTLTAKNPEQTKKIGMRLGRLLKQGDVIALSGDLGSGKTTLTKGIARGLGIRNHEYVNSPSFVIMKQYKGRLSMYHFDMYRLDELNDIEYLHPEEYIGADGVVVIEWAQRLKSLLPEEYLEIRLDITKDEYRKFCFYAHGKRYDSIVRRYFKHTV